MTPPISLDARRNAQWLEGAAHGRKQALAEVREALELAEEFLDIEQRANDFKKETDDALPPVLAKLRAALALE